MSTIDTASVFDAYRERLQVLLGDRADIAVVKTAIDSHPLGDEKAAP